MERPGRWRMLVGTVVAVTFAAACAPPGRTLGGWVDDKTITAKVKSRLGSLRAEPPTHINVETYNRTVYLTGVVPSEEMKARADAIAREVPDVELVVTNLQVKSLLALGGALAAPASVRRPPVIPAHPVLETLPGLRRLEGDLASTPAGPLIGHDGAGRRVATVYLKSMTDLAEHGMIDLRAAAPIDHVSIYAVPAYADQPEPYYYVVLWHVSPAEAAALTAPPGAPAR